jgi:hypothetical protein
MKQITLNRKQLQDLCQMFDHFKEVEKFTIYEDTSSGIGSNIHVKFDLFEKLTSVDITDYESW